MPVPEANHLPTHAIWHGNRISRRGVPSCCRRVTQQMASAALWWLLQPREAHSLEMDRQQTKNQGQSQVCTVEARKSVCFLGGSARFHRGGNAELSRAEMRETDELWKGVEHLRQREPLGREAGRCLRAWPAGHRKNQGERPARRMGAGGQSGLYLAEDSEPAIDLRTDLSSGGLG